MPVEISVRLLQKGEVLDEAHHMLHLWRPSASPSFVAAGKGRFDLNGKRWIPHGVNYMPSSGIGVEDRTYFEKWLGADAYHPRVIQRDLERCVAMGCNALSIFIYHESLKGHNLLDLLRRMDDLGMDKTNYDWYLNLRKFGGVEHAGYGLGFERMIMYLTGIQNIRDVLPFPRTAYGF